MRYLQILLGLSLTACTLQPPEASVLKAPLKQDSSKEQALVLNVVDGDTIRVRLVGGDEEYVRIIGIDTPEINWKTRKLDCYAEKAHTELTELLNGNIVELTKKPDEDRDNYNRLLRYVELNEKDIGAEMLVGGFAEDFPWFPHPRLEKYRALAREAKKAGAGMWEECYDDTK